MSDVRRVGEIFLARDPYDYIEPRGVLPTPFDPVALTTNKK